MSAADTGVVEQIRRELAQAVARLQKANAPTEALAALVTPRRILFVARQPKLLPRGRVWHLGVLLLAPDGTLFEVGSTTRAIEPGWPNYQSLSGEGRRAFRAAAVRGGFSAGEVVNFDATPVALDADSLFTGGGRVLLHDGRALVRWRASADAGSSIEFGAYLRERVELLIDPPGGV